MHIKSILQCPFIDIITNSVIGRKLIKLIMNSKFIIDGARFSIKERWF